MDFRSGFWLGHSNTLIFFDLNYSLLTLAVYLGMLSCWKLNIHSSLKSFADCKWFTLIVFGCIHLPIITDQLPCHWWRKASSIVWCCHHQVSVTCSIGQKIQGYLFPHVCCLPHGLWQTADMTCSFCFQQKLSSCKSCIKYRFEEIVVLLTDSTNWAMDLFYLPPELPGASWLFLWIMLSLPSLSFSMDDLVLVGLFGFTAY